MSSASLFRVGCPGVRIKFDVIGDAAACPTQDLRLKLMGHAESIGSCQKSLLQVSQGHVTEVLLYLLGL